MCDVLCLFDYLGVDCVVLRVVYVVVFYVFYHVYVIVVYINICCCCCFGYIVIMIILPIICTIDPCTPPPPHTPTPITILPTHPHIIIPMMTIPKFQWQPLGHNTHIIAPHPNDLISVAEFDDVVA